MNKIIKMHPHVLILVTLCGLFSCNSENKTDLLTNEDIQLNGEYVLSDTDAKALIVDFAGIQTRSNSGTIEIGARKNSRNYEIDRENGTKEIIPVYEYPLKQGDKNGYALVVGDNRIKTVLAYVDEGSLTDTLKIEPLHYYIKSIPQILEKCLDRVDPENAEIINTRSAPSKTVNNHDITLRDTVGGFELNCSTPIWGQNSPYNANCPNLGCSSNGGRAVVGCLAVALGEIMQYHMDKGTKVNIVQNSFGNSIAAFLADIGSQVYMNYGCSSSACSALYTRSALQHYGYSSSSWQTFNCTAIETSLWSQCPVFIIGFNTQGNIGHAWVIDGQTIGDNLHYYFHMNWGWNGSSNGYFNCGSLPTSIPNTITAGSYTFVFNTFEMLTNIY